MVDQLLDRTFLLCQAQMPRLNETVRAMFLMSLSFATNIS